MEVVDAIVIGAGVVGLACARGLAAAGREVLVIERAEMIGTGTSSRNSEVIHAGIYYPKGSLKALHCVRGRSMLYRYCEERGIAHRRSGKLIVATSEDQQPRLQAILNAGRDNGVDDLHLISAAQALEMEPALRCTAALSSPSTGIIDSHGLMLSLQADLEHLGGQCVFHSPVDRIVVGDEARRAAPGIAAILHIGGDADMEIGCRVLVNSAGIDAQAVARRMEGFPAALVPPTYYAKGNYFSLSGRSPFTRLIYPMPEQAGLGVHLTLDLAGQARFGPDVEWIDSPRYGVDVERARGFYAEIRKYWPGLRDGSLQAAYSGIRPKVDAPGEPASDFRILGPSEHGVDGVVQLFGIESPGLTGSLSIAEQVVHSLI